MNSDIICEVSKYCNIEELLHIKHMNIHLNKYVKEYSCYYKEFNDFYNKYHTINIKYFNNACFDNKLYVAKYFFMKGANVCNNNYLPLRWSCKNGNFGIVKWLMSIHPIINDRNILFEAFIACCYNDHLDIIFYLMNFGYPINNNFVERCSSVAVKNNSQKVLKWLHELKKN